MGEMIDEITQSNKEKEDAYRVKKRTLDLLPDAENNISKLQVKNHSYHYYYHNFKLQYDSQTGFAISNVCSL